MDNLQLSLAYALEMCMALPAAAMALAPVRTWLRLPERKVYPLAATICVILIAFGTIACSLAKLPSNVILASGALVLFAPYARLVRLPFAKKLFCYVNALMLCAFATMYAIVAASPWEAGNATGALLPQSGALALGLTILLGVLFGRTLIVKLPALLAHDAIDDMWRWIVIVPISLALLIYWMVPWDLSLMTLGRARIIMLTMTALIPLVIWLFYDIAWRVMSRVAESEKLRQENALLSMEERRFRDMQAYVAESRALRHDFRHHLLSIRGMLVERKLDELDSYIGQLANAEELGQRPQLCSNAAVDALAAHYDASARDKGVRISWNLTLPEAPAIPEADLCSILGNLVENALNATADLPEGKRWIEAVSEEITPAAIGIVVRNPVEKPPVFGDNGLPVTDAPGHGVGISSIAATTERYNGGIDAHIEEGIFSCGVVLYH